jgi:hypothetical protein
MITVTTFEKNPNWRDRLTRQTLTYSTTSFVKDIAGYAVADGKLVICTGKHAIVMDLEDAEIMADELRGICEDAEFRKNLGLELQGHRVEE